MSGVESVEDRFGWKTVHSRKEGRKCKDTSHEGKRRVAVFGLPPRTDEVRLKQAFEQVACWLTVDGVVAAQLMFFFFWVVHSAVQ